MKTVSAAEAIRAIPDGSTLVFPHGCVETTSLYDAFVADVERFRELRVFSGLSFGDYRFLSRGLGTSFRYFTWQASPRLRPLAREGKIGFVPIRYGDIHRQIRRAGPIRPDVVVVQVSPPDARGMVNLGTSVSLHRDLVDEAALVIAEINPNVPAIRGDGELPSGTIDLAVETDAPLGVYRTPAATDRDARIVDLVLDLVPRGATVQLGVGAVPDRVLERLGEKRAVRLFSGMLSQGLVRFVAEGHPADEILTGELAGDRELYEFCARTPLVRMATSRVTHDVPRVARFPRFTSINSAIEIDLHGQTNGETIGDVQVSGVGGSLDYFEAAVMSEGGTAILALPSTTDDGRSKIVARLSGGVVTVPRFCTDAVVTEYGVARLRGLDLHARAEALIAIAHPDHRDELFATFAGASSATMRRS